MSSNFRPLRFSVATLAALSPALAAAHTGVGEPHGLMHGFAHPIGGIDHVLAMVAVGIFAANLGGRAVFAVPLAFMAFIVFGGALGMSGVSLPFVELGIALSIVALGAAVAVKWDWPVAAAIAMVGLFAVFHGHTHGTEMPIDASAARYALGFVTATGVLHLVGIGIGLAIGRAERFTSLRIAQASGAAIAVVGVGVLTGIV